MPTPGSRLRAAWSAGPIMIPGAFNALVAKLAERLGFPAVIALGAALVTASAVASSEEPKPARTLVGKVVDEQGRPIAGAEVRLPIRLAHDGEEPPPVVTDAEGRFTAFAVLQEAPASHPAN